MRDDQLRLADMLESLEHIRSFASGGRGEIFQDVKTHEAVANELLKLGDASSHLSPAFRAAYPAVPWRPLVALRNVLAHSYYRVEPEALWDFVASELDDLERALRAISVRES